MFTLKHISKQAIPEALEKAVRYRLINEPTNAESICLDVLDSDLNNQEALTVLILALTDQFNEDVSGNVAQARALIERLGHEYERLYYEGIIHERRGKAILKKAFPGARYTAYDCFRTAMEYFEKAEAVHPTANEDATLRWNTCARMIMDNNLQEQVDDSAQVMLE